MSDPAALLAKRECEALQELHHGDKMTARHTLQELSIGQLETLANVCTQLALLCAEVRRAKQAAARTGGQMTT